MDYNTNNKTENGTSVFTQFSKREHDESDFTLRNILKFIHIDRDLRDWGIFEFSDSVD